MFIADGAAEWGPVRRPTYCESSMIRSHPILAWSRKRGAGVVLSCLILLHGSFAVAGEPGAASPQQRVEQKASPSPGFLLGEKYRYDKTDVLPRAAYDVVAIPAYTTQWKLKDWAIFSAVMAPTLGLMIPTDPSPDVRIDRWIQDEFDPWMPDIWGTEFQVALWGGLAVGGFGSWGYAALADKKDLAQGMSLMGESLAVTQMYHLTIKLLVGREGPRQGEGLGIFRGPAESFQLFPAGTPSGHFATLYAVFGSAQAYWQFPIGWDIAGHSVLAVLGSTHVINHRHFLSELIVGSAMGYAISHWVVRHRSTRYRYREGEPVRVTLFPRPRGFTLSVRF